MNGPDCRPPQHAIEHRYTATRSLINPSEALTLTHARARSLVVARTRLTFGSTVPRPILPATFTIRKFTKIPWTPVQLLNMGTLSPEMMAYFWILLEHKSNILISGGTASGKTTLLNAIAFFIPPEARVVSIEDTRELNLPRENWLPSVSRSSFGSQKIGEVDLFSLFL